MPLERVPAPAAHATPTAHATPAAAHATPAAHAPRATATARLAADDTEELALGMRPWQREFAQLEPGRFRGEVTWLGLGRVTLLRERYSAGMAVRGAPAGDLRGLSLLTAGQGATRFCGALIAPGVALATRPGREWLARTPPGLTACTVAVSREVLAHHAERLGEPDPDEILGDAVALGPEASAAAAPLRGFFAAALEASTTLEPQGAWRALEDALLDVAVRVAAARRAASGPRASTAFRRRAVLRALSWLREEAPATPRLTDLCAASRASARSLELGFREVFDVTPVQYLKRYRLHAVRRALGAPRAAALGVLRVAGAHGFWDPGHFARDYRALFGELPSATLRRSIPP